MKRAIKYLYTVNPFYAHLKKHYCYQCGKKLSVQYFKKIVSPSSAEADDYDFTVSDTSFSRDVEFRTMYFYCPCCNISISLHKMKRFEKQNKSIMAHFK